MASPTEVAAEIVDDLREGLEEVVTRRSGRALLSATRAIVSPGSMSRILMTLTSL